MIDSSLSKVKVAPYRSLWLEGLITLITMGCYLFVWFAMAARDCKRITGRPFTPVLWFFVPIICIPLPFASYILLNTFRDIEQEQGLPCWSSAQNIAWNLLFFCTYTGAYFVGEITDNPPLQWGLWAAAFALFLVLHQRLNRIRRQFEGEPLMHRFAGYNALEWVVGLLFIGMWGLVLWALGELKMINVDANEVPPGSVITVPEVGARFTVNQDGWDYVPTGTVTDGSADFELRGPASLNMMWYAVFSYDEFEDFSDIAQNRYSTYLESMPGATCSAERSLLADSLFLRAIVLCENQEAGDKQLYISHLIQKEKGIVELVGYMWVPASKYARYRTQFIQDVKGLTVDVE